VKGSLGATSPKGDAREAEQSHGPDGERATTTVTWHGCRRGESSEGCSATGNGTSDRVSHQPRAARPAAPLRRHERTAATRQRRPEPRKRHRQPGARRLSSREKPRDTRTTDLKRGEPHGWLQGAKNLRSLQRRKPPKPGGTARAERVRRVASSSRRKCTFPASTEPFGERGEQEAPRSQDTTGSGRWEDMSTEGRILTTPREESRS